MSDESKFSFFSPVDQAHIYQEWQQTLPTDSALDTERKANLRRAIFFAGVAILLIVANQLRHVKEDSDSHSSAAFVAGVKLVLYPEQHGDNQGLLLRFRLSNMGNHAVFYPVRPGTDVPIGQIVTRASVSSEWMALFGSSKRMASAVPEFNDSNLTWIEMPPGGWVDGEFSDPGDSAGARAYSIFLKPDRTADKARILSQPYHSGGN